MTSTPVIDQSLRDRLLKNPDEILDDTNLMKALVDASESQRGRNVVDMRGLAMERLEARLDRLEDTHRSVIAAAYENLAGTHQIHRAILRLLDPESMEGFLSALSGDVAETLRVDAVRILLERDPEAPTPEIALAENVLAVAPLGFVHQYLSGARGGDKPVKLRAVEQGLSVIYGDAGEDIRSEACMLLDFGGGRHPGLLVLGAKDPQTFAPQQATDLLEFFAGVAARQIRGWLT
ncbi:hypothetical protein SAMN05421688_2653 [Poseidonocella pacifica]|uniref:Recombinase XerC n=1 Tax=Poseidonocella pacifica TaxID=871651 RepID=A0A1I0Y1J9_9RHOB|nr:DUF484 family protein [Poseidonocella pacifica]SFB06073.1 hypothetical protein SAMN05421688_2653 [Poseidonocella pacifica]